MLFTLTLTLTDCDVTDDTNPDAETKEYIESLANDVAWLGWTPERTTYSSDNFQQLHDFAVQLIQRGKAYVCDMTKAEMEDQRELAMKRATTKGMEDPTSTLLPGRNRDTSVQRNLDLFQKMVLGIFEEGSYTLRLKMDFDSANPNMYDLVAYRIKYSAHPHSRGWCIYPSYDFTHGICDSLEHIDYSICTLEFETRREPYFWILHALDLFRPKVYEMSRLNLQYTVLSKRRLLKLVNKKFLRGWNDPRMPTISGLRRRGYTKDIINSFCQDVGATRAMNVVEMDKLYQTARLTLSTTAQRAMAALDPLLVHITNWADHCDTQLVFEVQNLPMDPGMGVHTITLTETFYIDSTDFRLQDSPTYYGLAPNKEVGLKYHGGNIICDQVIQADDGKVISLQCRIDMSDCRTKPKTYISWVPADGIHCEIRVYNHLFTVPEPSDLWEEELNPDSEVLYKTAIIDPSVRDLVDAKHVDPWKSNVAFQLERIGYFVVDIDTSYDSVTRQGTLVLNRTVSLKEEVFKKELTAEEEAAVEARKSKGRKDVEDKEKRMKIDPKDLFQVAEEYTGKYSKFHPETGIPTHTADGEELTKSAMKKLDKEKQKHFHAQLKWKKSGN